MELKIRNVDRKDPERVILQVDETCNVWPYILFDTTYDEKGNPTNLNRHSFIFPNKNVMKGDFIAIYTGKGETKEYRNQGGTTTHVFYWGLDSNVWNNEQDSALLVKVEEYKRYNV